MTILEEVEDVKGAGHSRAETHSLDELQRSHKQEGESKKLLSETVVVLVRQACFKRRILADSRDPNSLPHMSRPLPNNLLHHKLLFFLLLLQKAKGKADVEINQP